MSVWRIPMSSGKGEPVPANDDGWLVRNSDNESNRNDPLILLADTSLSCIRSTSPPNFTVCIPSVRTASSPPWKEFQYRALLDERNPCVVGAPRKFVTPGRLRISPANAPGMNAKEVSDIFVFNTPETFP